MVKFFSFHLIRLLTISLMFGTALLLGSLRVWSAEPEAPLFHYTPPASSAPVMGTIGVPTSSAAAVGSSINILILALDEADINAARFSNITSLVPTTIPATPKNEPALTTPLPLPPAQDHKADVPATAPVTTSIPTLPATGSTPAPDEIPAEAFLHRPPGRAQMVAAPLRRALVAAGFRDVLTTPLDGPSVLRSVNSARLAMRSLDALRFTTGQMLDAAIAGADRFTAEGGVVENAPASSSASPALAQARQTAIAAASRIGLTLGYRAVVVLAVAADQRIARPGAVYSLLVVDTPREIGEAFFLRQDGADEVAIDQTAAAGAAQNIAFGLRNWAPFTVADRAVQVEKYLATARGALQKNDTATAQDLLQIVVAYDPSNSEAYVLLGDALQSTDAVASARAYQRAAEINTKNGEVWAKIAIVHTLASPPDWVRSLQAARRAQQLGYDSANLRTSMAASEFGRADLFRRSGRIDQAEDAELVARRHLERARELAPDSPEVTANVSRLMAKYLLDQKRYKEAVQSLDLLAIQYPNDLQTQTMYARALEGYGKRDEDTFLAWARVWKLKGESEVPLDGTRYAVIADGFDQRIANIGKNAFQLTYGVSTGAMLRETALLQIEKSKTELKTAVAALQVMRPPVGRTTNEGHVQRLFAADLMQQAMEFYSIYLETGNDLNRTRALETHRQAMESLNAARTGAGTAANGV